MFIIKSPKSRNVESGVMVGIIHRKGCRKASYHQPDGFHLMVFSSALISSSALSALMKIGTLSIPVAI